MISPYRKAAFRPPPFFSGEPQFRRWFQMWYRAGGTMWQFNGWLFMYKDEAQALANDLVMGSIFKGETWPAWLIADHPLQTPVHELMRWG